MTESKEKVNGYKPEVRQELAAEQICSAAHAYRT